MLFQVIIALAINFSLKWKVLFIVNVLFTNEELNVKKKNQNSQTLLYHIINSSEFFQHKQKHSICRRISNVYMIINSLVFCINFFYIPLQLRHYIFKKKGLHVYIFILLTSGLFCRCDWYPKLLLYPKVSLI